MTSALSPMNFTADVFRRVREYGPIATRDWVHDFVASGFIDEAHYRVHQALTQIRDAELQVDRFNSYIANSETAYTVVTGVPASLDPIGGIPPAFREDTPDGLYKSKLLSHPLSTALDTSHLSTEDAEVFERASFGAATNLVVDDRVFVASDTRLSVLGWSDATVVSDNGFYHPKRSGRMPRLTGRALVAPDVATEAMAYILPFPYDARNYYHCMAEMAYGLRHVNAVPSDAPIIYDADPFGLLPIVFEAIGIAPSRLKSLTDMSGTVVRKAILPEPGPYYWSGDFVGFYRSIAQLNNHERPGPQWIYISRSRSARSLPEEALLESSLSERGFVVLHTEELSFREQIDAFRSASIIVGSHGAGMANMVFAPDTCLIIEIFQDSFINRDFQMRSQFVTPNYKPVRQISSSPSVAREHILEIITDYV